MMNEAQYAIRETKLCVLYEYVRQFGVNLSASAQKIDGDASETSKETSQVIAEIDVHTMLLHAVTREIQRIENDN